MASAAYHEDSGKVVLFGGAAPDESRLDDTWTWDGTWQHIAGLKTAPSARSKPLMALDEGTGNVVLYGGCEDSFCNCEMAECKKAFDDTWAWDGTQWTKLDPGVVPGQIDGTMAYHAEQAAMFRFAAGNNYRWTGEHWEQIPGNNPNKSGRFAAAYSPENGGILLFGGSKDYDSSDETWIFTCPSSSS
ncbi:MAG: hypothetical protein JNK56_04030 [Myxococcales bacterium]|nr:hypothetical protein [Myxococcales bacterium]